MCAEPQVDPRQARVVVEDRRDLGRLLAGQDGLGERGPLVRLVRVGRDEADRPRAAGFDVRRCGVHARGSAADDEQAEPFCRVGVHGVLVPDDADSALRPGTTVDM